MQNNVFLNNDNIIEVAVVGDQTAETIQAMGNDIEALATSLANDGQQVLILDDIQKMGTVSKEGRDLVIALGKKLHYQRLAMVGKPGLLRFGTNLLMQAMGRGNQLHYFDNRPEAIAWLLEAREQSK